MEPTQSKHNVTSLFNYAIIILMMVQPILGATSFGPVQILIEISLWVLLIYGVSKIKLNAGDCLILLAFVLASAGSFILNTTHTFLLNLKIYGLCVFTLIYFRKIYFNPKKLLFAFLLLNVGYAILAKNLNIWLIESMPFFEKAETYLYSRPVGFLGAPHATSTFLVIFFLYLFHKSKFYLLQLVIFYALILYSSWTVFLALLINIIYIGIRNFFKITIHPIVFLGVGLIILFLSMEMIFSVAGQIENSRSYSLEIMLPMMFNADFYKGVFPFFPKNHDDFIIKQEAILATVGNELGFIKIFIEGGFILAITTLYTIFKRTSVFSIIFLVTLFHYSYFVNMPIILYLAMTFTKDVESTLQLTRKNLRLENNKLNFLRKKCIDKQGNSLLV